MGNTSSKGNGFKHFRQRDEKKGIRDIACGAAALKMVNSWLDAEVDEDWITALVSKKDGGIASRA